MHTDASQAVGKTARGRGGARRRSAVVHGAQVLRTQGHRRVVRARVGATADRADPVRRRSRARPALGHLADAPDRGASARPPRWRARRVCADAAHARDLAMRLERELETIPGIQLQLAARGRCPGPRQCFLRGVEGESLVTGLPEIAVSTGSACSSATREAELRAARAGAEHRAGAELAAAFPGRFTTAADVDAAATAIRGEVSRLRVLAGAAAEGAAERRARPRNRRWRRHTLLGHALNPTGAALFPGAGPRPGVSRRARRPAEMRQAGPGARPTERRCSSS